MLSAAKHFVAWAGVPFLVEAVVDVALLVTSAVLLAKIPASRPYAASAIAMVLLSLGRVYRLQPAYRRACHIRVGQLADKRMSRCRVAWTSKAKEALRRERSERLATTSAAALASFQAGHQLYDPQAALLEHQQQQQQLAADSAAATAGNQLPASTLVLSQEARAQADRFQQLQLMQQQLQQEQQEQLLQPMSQGEDCVGPVRELRRISRAEAMHMQRRQDLREQQQQQQYVQQQPLVASAGPVASEAAARTPRTRASAAPAVDRPVRVRVPPAAVPPRRQPHGTAPSEPVECAVPVREAAAAEEAAAHGAFGGHQSPAASADAGWTSRIRILSCSPTPSHSRSHSPSRYVQDHEPSHEPFG